MQSINLIPANRREARRRRHYTRRWTFALTVYAAALLGICLSANLIFRGPSEAAADSLQKLRREADQIDNQIRQLKPQLAEARTTLAASRSVGSQPDWSLLLALLASELGDDAMLSSLRVEPVTSAGVTLDPSDRSDQQPPYRLRIAGLARTQSDVSDYVLRLENTNLFDKVTLIDTRKEPFRESSAVSFRIACELTP